MTFAADDRMGVSTHFGQNWDFDTTIPHIKELGVGWIRDDINWVEVETAKGVYKFPERFSWIKKVHGHGLKLILHLCYENPIYENPQDTEAYARCAGWIAKELGDYVDAFEIISEPHNHGYVQRFGGSWNGYDGNGKISPWIKEYVNLMNKTAEAVKAVRPNMKVLGLAGVPSANFYMYTFGISPLVDGVTDHPYSYHLIPELVPFAGTPTLIARDGIATADVRGSGESQIEMYRQQAAKYKGPSEMWMTEWGFTDHQPLRPGMYAGVTPSAQAKYAQRRFMEHLGMDVKVSIWYDFRNDGVDPHEPEQNFGLMTMDLKPKLSYFAVQRLAKIMEPWKPSKFGTVKVFPMADRPDQWPINWEGAKLAATGAFMSYQFVDDKGNQAVSLWSAERADGDLQPRIADVEITTPKKVTRVEQIDMMTGKKSELPFTQKGQAVQFKQMTVPDHPLLLIFIGEGTAQAQAPTLMPLFTEGNKDWKFITESDVLGFDRRAGGAFRTMARDGQNIGFLGYDFRKGGAYAAGLIPVSVAAGSSEFRVDVKADDTASVFVQMIDESGQCHRWSAIPYTQAGNWQTARVLLNERAPIVFGGAGDGKIHYPVKSLAVGVSNHHQDRQGTMQFAQMEWIK